MAKFSCCSWRKVEQAGHALKNVNTLQINLQHTVETFVTDKITPTSFDLSIPFHVEKSSKLNVKLSSHESPVGDAAEVAYKGEDESKDNSMKQNFFHFHLQSEVSNEEIFDSENILDEMVGQDIERAADAVQNEHLSDPGIAKTKFLVSPKLKRSCCNFEMRDKLRNIAPDLPLSSKLQSLEELQQTAIEVEKDVDPGSQGLIVTHHNADRVMLKKHFSSQILPSRRRRLWWKLLLWIHKNLHKTQITETQPPPMKVSYNQQDGYCSDTLEPKHSPELNKKGSPGTFTEVNKNTRNDQIWSRFHNSVSGFCPQNQCFALSTESSSLERVSEWVKDLQTKPHISVNDGNTDANNISPASPQIGRSPERILTPLSRRPGPDTNKSEEILYANNVVQSLNTSSTVAHISGIGLTAIPIISHFSSLQSVNLSSNFIVCIKPGSLPKGLHTLNLTRNKINTTQGLRELTRLRILDLSYNRISQIGHGLSNCTLIKELYLAENKITDVEGLHRLIKLTVLDLSFNKITTTKALGHLVANYDSLLSLNIVGNPIQNNVRDDQLRKSMHGLLPNLVYLNKQPTKAQRAQKVCTNGVAKAELGNTGRSTRRKSSKKVSGGGSYSTSGQRGNTIVAKKVKHKSTGPTHRLFCVSTPPALASASNELLV